MKQKVIVIGHGYTSRLSVIRSVAEIGCDVSIISMVWYKSNTTQLAITKPIDAYSKYVSNVYYCYRKGEKELIQLLLDKCKDEKQKPILIPDTDFTAATIDKYKDVLKPYFLFPYIQETHGNMTHWMDKDIQKVLARNIGINVAESSTIIEVRGGQYSIPSGIKYPCYPKPIATISGGKGSGGMRRCDCESELIAAINLMKRGSDLKILVEDFKPIDREYAVLGFTDGKDVLIPGAIQQLIVSKRNKGIAMTGKVMPANEFGGLIDKFKEFVLATGFIGIFDIDFFLSEGKYYFCEINLRFGGSGYAVTKMGVNLPAILVRYLCGESIDGMKKSFSGTATYVNERMCMDDWQNCYISTSDFFKTIEIADISFIKDKNDPEPEHQFRKMFENYRLKHFIRLCLRNLKLR